MQDTATIASRRQTIKSKPRSAKDAFKPLLDARQEQFCHLYANSRNGTRSYLEAFPGIGYDSAAQLSSKLLRNELVLQRIRAIVAPTAKRFTPDEIRAEFRNIYDHSKSEHIRIRILEDLSKIEGMFIEKNVNLNANVDVAKMPDLSQIPLNQLESEFIKRMKLEHTGVETFKALPSPTPEQTLLISHPSDNEGHTQGMAQTEQAQPSIDIERGGGGVCPDSTGAGVNEGS